MTETAPTVIPAHAAHTARRLRRALGATLVCVLLAAVLSGCSARRPSAPAAVDLDPAPRASILPVRVSEHEWEFEGMDGKLLLTDHYRLRTTETHPLIIDRLPGFLEASFARYSHAVTDLPAPKRRMDTYLFANRGQWKRFTGWFLGRRSELYAQIPRGGYTVNGTAVLWQIGPRDTFSIAAHEGWHQYTQTTFRTPLPMWLDEGMATYMEGYRFNGSEPVFLPWANTERFNELRDAEAAEDLISLADLISSSPMERMQLPSRGELTYYAQVWALVHFLLEWDGGAHRAQLEQLLRDAAEGRMHERLAARYGARAAVHIAQHDRDSAIFRAYFGDDLESLERSYRACLRRLVAPGSRNRVVEGRSPLVDD